MTEDALIGLLQAVLTDDDPWCGCYEGDLEEFFIPRRDKAIEEIVAILRPYLEKAWMYDGLNR